jgi:hypothetical protein
MHLRIVSIIDSIGRRWYVQEEHKGRRVLGYQFSSRWKNVGSIIGYDDEASAKEFAEDYAKGNWISDSATFNAGD